MLLLNSVAIKWKSRTLKPPRAADTHTRWKLPAKSGGAAFEGLGGILLLAAQLGDGGERRTVPLIPDVQSHLQ